MLNAGCYTVRYKADATKWDGVMQNLQGNLSNIAFFPSKANRGHFGLWSAPWEHAAKFGGNSDLQPFYIAPGPFTLVQMHRQSRWYLCSLYAGAQGHC